MVSKKYLPVHRNRGIRFAVVVINMTVVVMPSVSVSAEWEIKPSIELTQSYDDNIKLSGDNQEESDYITEVTPALSVQGKGKTSRLLLRYRMQNLYYQHNGGEDNTYHNVNYSSNTEFIRDRLFLDLGANYGQRNIDNEAPASFNNSALSDNRSDFVSYSARSYFVYPFGRAVLLRVERSYSELDNKSDELSDSDSITRTSSINLQSGASFTDLKWSLYHKEQITNYRERAGIESQDTRLNVNYYLSSKLYLIGIYGHESYNYEPRLGQKKPEGDYWDTGVGWSPTQRTNIELTSGEHYFGQTKGLRFNHHTRKSVWAINYSENITTTSTPQAETVDVQSNDAETDESSQIENIYMTNVATVSRTKALSISIKKSLAKTDFIFDYSKTKREFLDAELEDESNIYSAAVKWSITGKSTFEFSKNVQKSILPSSNDETELNRNQMRFGVQHNRRASSFISYARDSQGSELRGQIYTRNIYKLGFMLQF